MLSAEQINEIHRLHWAEHWPVRKIARHLHIGRRTIVKYLVAPAQTAGFPAGFSAEVITTAWALPLSPIRSLAYFQPVIDELLSSPLSDSYVEYLRSKMKPFAGKKVTESTEKVSGYRVQKTTDSDDR